VSPGGEEDPLERKRLLELVSFARRDQDRRRFTWRHGMFIALAVFSLVAALRTWTTWRSFHRPVEVHVAAGITAAEQSKMLAAIRADSWVLDPVSMDAATFQNVLLGRGRIERSVSFSRDGRDVRAVAYRSEGDRNRFSRSRSWHFDFDETGRLKESYMIYTIE